MISPDNLLAVLAILPVKTGKFWIAYSGGMDSSVLLHLFYALKGTISNEMEAVYVNHGLNSMSEEWRELCREQCKAYRLGFCAIDINAPCPDGESVEAWARERRYTLIAEKMREDHILFSAHHRDDQVETFFLQALRGAGPRGLAAMPVVKTFTKGFHVRPLLGYTRDELAGYALENRLVWHDDESNRDTAYDRNYLRHEVLPNIEKKWPAYRNTINRLIGHQQEYKVLLDQLARDDLQRALWKGSMNLGITVLKTLDAARQKNLIFYWLDTLRLAAPSCKHITNILAELINTDTDKSPCVNWPGVEVRRYRDLLYAFKPLKRHDNKQEYHWDLHKPMSISGETLMASPATGSGVSKAAVENTDLTVRYRRGGEKIYLATSSCSKSVKRLFQEKGVLPWYRDRVPLIYINDQLAVIPGFCVDKKYAAAEQEPSWNVVWSGYRKVLQ